MHDDARSSHVLYMLEQIRLHPYTKISPLWASKAAMVRFGVQSDEHAWALRRLLRPIVEEVSVYLGLVDIMSVATSEKLSFTKIMTTHVFLTCATTSFLETRSDKCSPQWLHDQAVPCDGCG